MTSATIYCEQKLDRILRLNARKLDISAIHVSLFPALSLETRTC